uniref:TNF receptor superfamily member 4 n=2 Tax=Macaca mulatta TaxID=9544 RepID=A0A5F8ANR9_MACMU
MCVGARRLGRGPCAALLLLGLGLSTTAKLHCVGDTYPSNDRCCQECRPGNGMVSRCNRSQNTVCRPCGPGFYNDVVSAKPCKACTWCNLRSGSERKQPCTATQDTVCRCRAGTQPLDSYKPGVGELGGCGRQLGVSQRLSVTQMGRGPQGTGPTGASSGILKTGLPGQGPRVGCGQGGLPEAKPTTRPWGASGNPQALPHVPSTQGLWAAPDHPIFVADCAPCPPGHFSPGDNQACKPWTNCTLAGKHTLQPASNSSDAICEDRDPPPTQPQETQGPPARPTTVQPTEAWPRTSQRPSTRPVEVPRGKGAWPSPAGPPTQIGGGEGGMGAPPADSTQQTPSRRPCGCCHPGPGPGAGAAGPPGHAAGPAPAPEGPEAAPRCPQSPWGRQFPDPHPRGAG